MNKLLALFQIFGFFLNVTIATPPEAYPMPCKFTRDNEGVIIAADCSNRNLDHVPDDLPPTLRTLDLKKNMIHRLQNYSFSSLRLLTDLDLAANRLSQLEPDAFLGLVSLRSLIMMSNNLALNNATYPKFIFQDLKQLRILDISKNINPGPANTGYPDSALTLLPNLREIHMDGLDNITFGPGFQTLSRLEVIDMNGEGESNSSTQFILKDMFVNIRTKRPLALNLARCDIRYIHSTAFRPLYTLWNLDLAHNRHLSFHQFMIASESFQYTSLEVLNVTLISKEYGYLEPEYFQHLPKTNLTSLVLEHNSLTCIQIGSITKLPRTIKYLSFRNNKILDALFLLEVVKMSQLQVFDMGMQNHNSRRRETVSDLIVPDYRTTRSNMEYCKRNPALSEESKPLVERLRYDTDYITNNLTSEAITCGDIQSLKGFHIDVVPLPPSLEILVGDHMKLEYSIPNISFHEPNKLKFLNLSSDLLTCLGGPLYGLHHLRVLDLSKNKCDDVSPIFFHDLQSLVHLHLNENLLGHSLSADKEGQTFVVVVE